MYAELHCHSAFSFLDGASLPDELVAAALELGYSSLALTDHNTVSGSMEFAVSARALGLRAIHGAELDLDDGRHLTLLVENERGWSSLCRILTRAHAHTRDALSGRQGVGGRGPFQAMVPLSEILDHSEGLVCLSGCALRGVHDEPTLLRLRESFGADALRIELQRPFLRDDRARNRRLSGLAERLGLRCVATGNVHAHARSRAPLQDAFVAIRTHSTLDASEPQRRGNFSHVLASPAAMAARFPEYPEAVAESIALADRLRFDLCRDLGYRYPGAEDEQAMRALTELAWDRLRGRYAEVPGSVRAEADARLEQELGIIERLNLPGFFLLHHDLLELAREVAVEVRGPSEARALLPPGRGRGSSVSSIVCYLTGLSHVDPIENDLLIGRFLNEELTSLPDIDLDFPRDIREVLIPRVHERYGHDRSALVAAFPTYRSRGAIRELGKALGLPPGEIERLARGSEGWDARFVGRDIEATFEVDLGAEFDGAAAARARDRDARREVGWDFHDPPPPEVDPRRDRSGTGSDPSRPGSAGHGSAGPSSAGPGSAGPGSAHPERRGAGGRWRWLARLAAEAHGLPRHLSQHSGGMIVSTRPLIDCCPIVPAAMEGRQIVQWDKDSCADAGFLKIDLLGLGMLSAVERCVEMIARTRREHIDLSRIPYDDPATYECIQTADTTGVFQIESRAQMQSLRRTRPETLKDITIQVAIVRPGPIQGGAVNPYIERRQRLRVDPTFEVPYEHPSLKPVLQETLGTIIFQDQVLEVAIAFAGFSTGEAEGLRRAMSRKRSEAAIEAHHRRFVAGAQRTHGVDEATAERVFAMVQGFSGFGFPKAHGAAFGLLAYQSTWLRVHYGEEFLCSLLNEQPMGFYPPDALVHEAQRRGFEVLAPDVNDSQAECEIEFGEPPVVLATALPAPVLHTPLRVQALPAPAPHTPLRVQALPASAPPHPLRVRIGLGYVRGVKERDVRALVDARDAGGRFRNLSDLASRAGAGTPALELLAWSGACDSLVEEGTGMVSARRLALWQLGVSAPGRNVPGGVQLSLPLDLPAPPKLRQLSRWESMLADYATTGLTVSSHPMLLLRDRLPKGTACSEDLGRLEHGARIQIGGLVVARQRPGTASGVVFVLLEDEFGTINLIIPPKIYEQHRLLVRTEPLLLVAGKLERFAAAGGAINVLVDRVSSIAAPDRLLAEIKDFSMLDEQVRQGLAAQKAAVEDAQNAARQEAREGRRLAAAGAAGAATDIEDFRAVAPPVLSFASGRRR